MNLLNNSKCFNDRDLISQHEWSELEGKSPKRNAEDLYCGENQKFGQYPCDPVLFIFLNDEKETFDRAHCGIRSTLIKFMKTTNRIYLWKLDSELLTRTYAMLVYPYYKFPLLSIHIDENGLHNLKHSRTFLFAVKSIGKHYVGTAADNYVSAIHGQNMELYTLIPVFDTDKFMANKLTMNDIPKMGYEPVYTNIINQAKYVNEHNQDFKYDINLARFFNEIRELAMLGNKISKVEQLVKSENLVKFQTSSAIWLIKLLLLGDKLLGIRVEIENEIKIVLNPHYKFFAQFCFNSKPPFGRESKDEHFEDDHRLVDSVKNLPDYFKYLLEKEQSITTILTKHDQIGRFKTVGGRFIYSISGEINTKIQLSTAGFYLLLSRIWHTVDKIQIYNDVTKQNIVIYSHSSSSRLPSGVTSITYGNMYPYIVLEPTYESKIEVYKSNVKFDNKYLPLLTGKMILSIPVNNTDSRDHAILVRFPHPHIKGIPFKYIYMGYSPVIYEFETEKPLTFYTDEKFEQSYATSRDKIYFLNEYVYIWRKDTPELMENISRASELYRTYETKYKRLSHPFEYKILQK